MGTHISAGETTEKIRLTGRHKGTRDPLRRILMALALLGRTDCGGRGA